MSDSESFSGFMSSWSQHATSKTSQEIIASHSCEQPYLDNLIFTIWQKFQQFQLFSRSLNLPDLHKSDHISHYRWDDLPRFLDVTTKHYTYFTVHENNQGEEGWNEGH